jgi:hypothetical protein
MLLLLHLQPVSPHRKQYWCAHRLRIREWLLLLILLLGARTERGGARCWCRRKARRAE